MSSNSAEKERAMVLKRRLSVRCSGAGFDRCTAGAHVGAKTYDWGRRPLGFQSRSMSSSDRKPTVGGMLALVGVAVGEVAILVGQ